MENLIKLHEEYNDKKRYTDLIRNMKREMKKAKERKPPVKK